MFPDLPGFPALSMGVVIFYAHNFEKVGSILLSARPSVQKNIKARVLKFHIWIPHQKIA